MAGEHIRVTSIPQPPEHIGGTLDIGEEKSEGPHKQSVRSPRTAQVRMVNTYLPRLHAAAAHDPAIGTAFLRVMGLLDPPESLLRPGMARRVLARRRPAAARPPLEGALR